MCYRYEYYNFSNGKFDDIVDCTYVLLMENSSRERSILETVSKYTLTSKCIIQYNKGYKNCKKDLKKQLPNHDLVHSLQTVFKHAIKSGYQRILVLEDDCTFDERINDPKVINDISSFIYNNDPKIYSLGTPFHFSFPWEILFSNNQRLLFTGTTHAIIYNIKYMKEKCDTNFLDNSTDTEFMRHWDKFTYYKPLAYQTFPDTENSGSWFFGLGLKPFLNRVLFHPLELDKKAQPGFDKIILINKSICFIIFLLLLYYLKKLFDKISFY
jgi:hypothetical protein